jgi:hypothetical protein
MLHSSIPKGHGTKYEAPVARFVLGGRQAWLALGITWPEILICNKQALEHPNALTFETARRNLVPKGISSLRAIGWQRVQPDGSSVSLAHL